MSIFRTRIPKWTAVSRGVSSCGRGQKEGGSKSSSIELLPRDSEGTRKEPNSFSSVWKPVWYTGWHTGVLACATSVVVVLLINVGLTIYVAVNPKYKMVRGIGTLYRGSCGMSRTIGVWVHLLINILSTLLLSGSNYTQQCLAAPTRSEIDAAHARRQWMDIGVPSIRNLFRIKAERTFLWIAIGITSIPLHLLYNSAVFTSLAANEFRLVIVSSNHFEQGSHSNTTKMDQWLGESSPHVTAEVEDWYSEFQTDSNYTQPFNSMLEGYNVSTLIYKNLTASQCIHLYNNDLISSHRNLFLITNYTSNRAYNSTILDIGYISRQPREWMCTIFPSITLSKCNANELASRVANGDPWVARMKTGEVVKIRECKSEIIEERCKVQFSLRIMIAVICCNLVKACCMVMAVFRSREPTLVTLGDAVDSFLRVPDPTTVGICFADRRFIKREWRCGWKAGPRQWKRKGPERWWTSVSKTRWITCYLFCLTTIIATGVLLRMAIVSDGHFMSTDLKSMWDRGLGRVNTASLVSGIGFRNETHAALVANLPQTILSFLYLTYNSLFTCMLSGNEWSLFSHHHRTLRVTSPRPGQRSTYWLQIPYTYAMPLMALSSLLHWLTSQSLFPATIEIFTSLGSGISGTISTVGYSCIGIIFVLTLGILALLAAAGMGYKIFAAEITTVGSCSAAISAACHTGGAGSEDIVCKKVRWGDVGIVSNTGVRHLTFSSDGEVRKPVFGEVYSGIEESARL